LKQWIEHQKTRACVPHTPYTSVLKFVPPQVGCVAQPRTQLVEMQAMACLLLKQSINCSGYKSNISEDLMV